MPLIPTLNPSNEGIATNVIYVSTINTTSLYPTKVTKGGSNEPGFLNFLRITGFESGAVVKRVALASDTRKFLLGHEFLDSILKIWFIAEWKLDDGSGLAKVKKSDLLSSNLVVTVETEPTGEYSVTIPVEISVSDVIDPLP